MRRRQQCGVICEESGGGVKAKRRESVINAKRMALKAGMLIENKASA